MGAAGNSFLMIGGAVTLASTIFGVRPTPLMIGCALLLWGALFRLI